MGLSKTNLDYWKSHVKKREFKKPDGTSYLSANYHVRIRFDGSQKEFNLETPNRDSAANKAREIWEYYQVNGTEATLLKFKKKKDKKKILTVGAFVAEIEKSQLIKPKTFTSYRRKLFQLVAGIENIRPTKSRYDYVGKGAAHWRKRIEDVNLEKLTPKRISNWRAKYISGRSENPITRKKAEITASSILRNAKTLFSPKYLDQLSIRLDHDPFKGIIIGSSTTRKYRSTVNFKELAENSREQLFLEIPEAGDSREEAISTVQQFKILLLALGCGLRRGEIDLLQWADVDFEQGTITVEESEFGMLKSETSYRTIDVDSEVMELFAFWRKNEKGKFVVISSIAPRPNAAYHHYRCDKHFKSLLVWLKSNGIDQRNALHELRKEYGSRVCQQFGVYAASSALGHSNIRITAASYLEKKERTAVKVW